MYFELLDIIITQLRDCFCSDDVTIAVEVQTLLLESITSEEPKFQTAENAVKFYDGDFSTTQGQVKAELQVFYNFVKQNFPQKEGNTAEATDLTVKGLAKFFLSILVQPCFQLFCNCSKILTMLVTSATAEDPSLL